MNTPLKSLSPMENLKIQLQNNSAFFINQNKLSGLELVSCSIQQASNIRFNCSFQFIFSNNNETTESDSLLKTIMKNVNHEKDKI